MGYNLHITRRSYWADIGNDITCAEWLDYVLTDRELKLLGPSSPLLAIWDGPSVLIDPWLDWSDGQIFTKNPDALLINKMIEVAERLGAVVQGDEGEAYMEQVSSSLCLPRQSSSKPSIWRKLRGLFIGRGSKNSRLIQRQSLPFGVGDRVRDHFGNEHVVLKIDPAAEHGMGVIRTKRSDGVEMSHMIFAHGLCSLNSKNGLEEAG